MRQIRRSAFETNSSSMHSLVIKKDDHRYYTYEEATSDMWGLNEGIVRIADDDIDFGRAPFETLPTMFGKARYTLAAMCKYKNDAVYKEVCEAVRSLVPEFEDFKLKFITTKCSKSWHTEEEIKKWWGEGNYISVDDEWIVWGYDTGNVDEDILTGFLEQENISIKEFITNKKYIVVVDGDEYCIYETMKESGLINLDNIEKEYPNRKEHYEED